MSEFKFPDEIEKESPKESKDEVEIELVDDTPEVDRGREPLERAVIEPSDDELASYSKNVQARMKELTRVRHDERRAKEAVTREKQDLERIAQQLYDENNQLKQYVQTGSKQYIDQSKTLATNELESARIAYKKAQEAFDADAILAAQEALLEAKMKVNALDNIRQAPLQQPQNRVQPQQYAPQEVPLDEKTLRWQAKNQWFSADGFEDVSSYALGLHKKLINAGYDPRSDEYFSEIDTRVKDKFPEVFGNERAKSNESPRRPVSVVSPAARSSGKRTIQMTPRAMALAKKFGITPQQYAIQQAKLENSNE
jgi:hypothetical protein